MQKLDGNPLFFPIDDDTFSAGGALNAQIPSEPKASTTPSNSWPYDVDASGQQAPAQLQLHQRGPLLVQVRGGQDLQARLRRRRRRLGLHQQEARRRPGRHPHAGARLGHHRRRPPPASSACRARQRLRDRRVPGRAPDHLLVLQADPERLHRRAQRLPRRLRRRHPGHRRGMRRRREQRRHRLRRLQHRPAPWASSAATASSTATRCATTAARTACPAARARPAAASS